jgi:hypothetical protein
VHALHAVVEANCRRPGGSVIACQPQHLLGHDAAGARDTLGRPLARALGERFVTHGVAVDVIPIDERLVDQHVHDPEGERRVGAGQQRDVLVALFRRRAAIRIDRDELRTAPLRFLRAGPEMQVRSDRVAAPDQDQPAVDVLLDVHADRRADYRSPSGLAGGRADRAVEQRRAETMEEAPIHRRALQKAHRARIAVGQYRLRSVTRCSDGTKALGDLAECLLPGDARKASFALRADPSHRMAQPLRRVRAIEVVRDLSAKHAGGRRMIGIAADLDGAAILDGDKHRARVRAIVRARGAHDASFRGIRAVERHRAIVRDRRCREAAANVRRSRRASRGFVDHDVCAPRCAQCAVREASITYRAPINGIRTWHGCCSTAASRRASRAAPDRRDLC